MIDYVKQILTGQFEASLAMLNQCISACPPDHWEDKIGQGTFRWIVYHTLFFVDLYLTPSEKAFEPRDLHQQGGDERHPIPSAGLSKDDSLAYVSICRQKAADSVAAENSGSLAGPSGFSWYPCTRGELHLINIRHIQHHTGQLSAYLRRVDETSRDHKALPWIATGWR